jgi:hypothetical protein
VAKRLESTRALCRELRKHERLSYDEISAQTGVSRGTLHYWLKDLPLTEEELAARRGVACGKGHKSPLRQPRKYQPGAPSKFMTMVTGGDLTRDRQARISESAVQFRLVIAGLNPFGSPFDGERTDTLVENPVTGRIVKVQVRTAQKGHHGLPFISLERKLYGGVRGKCRFKKDDFDFIAGYDLHTDTCYVFSWDETEGLKRTITVRPDAAERWDKLV